VVSRGFRGGTYFSGYSGRGYVGGRGFYGRGFGYPRYYYGGPSVYFGFGSYWGYPYYWGGYPYYYDPYYYDPYYYNGGSPYYYGPDSGYVSYPASAPAPASAPVVVQQSIGSPSSGSFYRAADFYLIAFNDHTIQAALSYRVEGDQILWVSREHEDKSAPLSSVDRRFSEQINRDRRVEFRLP
jgi:hypothetical protein